ncbi:MAG: hypothetical protein QM811_09890 [Pirellulales bacterium]
MPVLAHEESKKEGVTVVSLHVPNGGAVAYRVVDRGTPADAAKIPWRVLTMGGAIELKQQQRLVARGVRLGYLDSEFLNWSPGSAAPEASKPETYDGPKKLRALAKSTLPGSDVWQYVDFPRLFRDTYKAKPESSPYWLFHSHGPLPHIQSEELITIADLYWLRTMTYSAKLLNDPRPAREYLDRARMSSVMDDYSDLWNGYLTELLSTIGLEDAATITFLESTLKSKNEFLGLQAALVLESLGEKARPALATIRAQAGDKDYPGRVCTAILRKLDPKGVPATAEKSE